MFHLTELNERLIGCHTNGVFIFPKTLPDVRASGDRLKGRIRYNPVKPDDTLKQGLY